jgi:hypothetical protein
MLSLLLRRFYCLLRRDVREADVNLVRWGGGDLENVVVCLFDPFVCEHFDCCFASVGITIA